MHARDSSAHGYSAGDECGHGSAYNHQRDERGRYRDDHRQEHKGNVVADWYGKMEGEHADEVHAPDAEAHHCCSTCEPTEPRRAGFGSHASGDVERGE